MSHAATKWAFDQPEKFRDMAPAEWAVLVVLADCHNAAYGCFPSHEYICSRINVSDRAMRGHLARLRERGLIDWEPPAQRGVVGQWNRYYLAFEDGFVPHPPALQPADSAGCPTGKIEHAQPAESDTPNRQNATSPYKEEPVKEEPVIEPEREARARPGEDGPTVEAAFDALIAIWPNPAAQSGSLARSALSALSGGDRKTVVERAPAFLAFHRETQGKRPPPFLHNFVGERHRWTTLPAAKVAPAGAAGEKRFLGIFDRDWWAVYWRFVERGESRSIVNMVSLARARVGFKVANSPIPPAELDAAAKALVQVRVGLDEFKAWQAAMVARGLDLPRPDKAEWIYVPSQWPPDERQNDMNLRDAADIAMGAG
jgi:hypothetical protein